MRGGGPAAGRAAIFAGTFAALLNMSVVTVALPRTAAGLGADAADVAWVVDAYTLSLSALMLSGGVLGDRYGRRRVWLAAVALLGAGSVVCATAPSAGPLIAGRVVQGAASAVLVPGAMSLIAQAHPDPAGRARVIGWWSTVASLSVGLGPLLGGVLVDVAGWRGVFWVTVPLCLVVPALGASGLTESRDPAHAGLDPAGQALGAVWLGSLGFGLIEGGRLGWGSAVPVAALCLAAAALALFVRVELRVRRPMLPVRMLRDARFAASGGAALLLGLGAYAIFFHLSPYFQQVRHCSATGVGLRMLPMALGMSLLGAVSGRLTARYGPYGPMAGAFALIAGALLALAAVLGPRTPYPVVAVLLAGVGAGIGVVLPPLNAAALAAVPRERSGAAAATVNAARQVGTSLGIALLGAVLAAVAGGHGGRAAGGAGAAAAFTSGLRVIAAIAGVISVVAAGLVLVARGAAAARPAGPGGDAPAAFRSMEN